ncbi:MAG: tetratricopeptide repeat protein [Balneolaceae bacterium]
MKLFITLLLSFLFISSSVNDARKANEAYRNGDYEQAVELFNSAIEQNPDDARLHFNLGNALAELGRVEEAMEAFNRYKSLSDQPRNEALGDYNQGKLLSDQEKYEEALTHFREALKKNPDDADAKYNYELAMKKQQEQEQNQEQQSDSDDNQDQDQDQNQDQNQQQDQSQDQQENNDQNQEQEQQPGEQPQSPENSEEQENEGEQPQPAGLSPEEAENILEALEQLERDLLEGQKKEATESPSQNEQDW